MKTLSKCSSLIVTSALILFLTGCASPSNETDMRASAMLKGNGNVPGRSTGKDKFDSSVWEGLIQAAGPGTPSATSARAMNRSQSALPASLANSTLIQKLINANLNAIPGARSAGETEPAPETVKFKYSDFKQFLTETIPAVGVTAWNPNQKNGIFSSNTGARAIAKNVGTLLEKYLIIYIQGNFVDRAGNAISKPSIQGGKVGNDTITGLASVILEALNDSFYNVPVFCESDNGKPKWFNATGKEPTFAALAKNSDTNNLNYDKTKVVVTSDSETNSITSTEADAIQFLSGVASEESKAVSGLVFKLFGGATASFVLGGKLSIGDNQTLGKLVDTFFEVNSYRTTEALTYAYLKKHNETNSGEGLKSLLAMLKELRQIYKDYSKKS